MKKIILTAFTDPMMGLSYESEPIMERLQKECGDSIEFKNVMGLLVRDVADFMTPEERSLESEDGIPLYCRRLAQIYKSEEAIGGLPINMDGFCLFDKEHRSSKPLNLAFARRLGIHSLPTYLIEHKDRALLMQSFQYQDFADAIKSVTQ